MLVKKKIKKKEGGGRSVSRIGRVKLWGKKFIIHKMQLLSKET